MIMERGYRTIPASAVNGYNNPPPPPPQHSLDERFISVTNSGGPPQSDQSNSGLAAIENQFSWPVFVPMANHQQQNSNFLTAGNQINTNNLGPMIDNNNPVSLLGSEFSRLSLAPTSYVEALSHDVRSGRSGNRDNSMPDDVDDLFRQQQLRDMQRMRIQSAARGQVGSYLQPQPYSDFNSFDEFRMNQNLNECWSIPNQYNNSLRNLNDYNQPQSIGNGLGSLPPSSYHFQPSGNYLDPSSSSYDFQPRSFGNGFGSSSSSYDFQPRSFGNGFGSSSSSYDFQPRSYGNGFGSSPSLYDFQARPFGNGFGSSARLLNSSRQANRSSSVNGIARNARDWRSGSISRPRQWINITSLEDLRGNILPVSKDQLGSKFLQERLEKGNLEEVNMIIAEIKDHICELMVDQFGNYLVKPLLGACYQNQQLMTELLMLVIQDEATLKNICVDSHGTTSMQLLLKHLTTQEQKSLAVSGLRPITVSLTKSMNSHHVLLYCLSNFSTEDNKVILTEVANSCMEIALDRSGCCVLQQCLEHAVDEPRERLIADITSNALLLSGHPYGNYVVQYVVGLKLPHATAKIMKQLTGSFASLSLSKFGSNVVEKFLHERDYQRVVSPVIKELVNSPSFLDVLKDPYGNYVSQTALVASKGEDFSAMEVVILKSYAKLHSHPHGKRVYSCLLTVRESKRSSTE